MEIMKQRCRQAHTTIGGYRNDRLMIKAKDREGYYEINMKLHNFTFVSDYRELLRNVEKVGKSTRVVI